MAAAPAILVKPDWLFLDEATSAVDASSEAQVYQALRECLPATTIVSIGHRRSLVKFHDRFLVFARDGASVKLREGRASELLAGPSRGSGCTLQ